MNTTTPRKTKDPDDLVKDVNLSMMPKGLLIAFAIHAVIIFGTSFGLYRDWWGWNPEKKAYGFLATPSTINHEKQKDKSAAEEAKRQAATAQREAERAANVQAAATSAPAKNTAASLTSGNDDLDIAPKEADPLPPKKLDDLDIDSLLK